MKPGDIVMKVSNNLTHASTIGDMGYVIEPMRNDGSNLRVHLFRSVGSMGTKKSFTTEPCNWMKVTPQMLKMIRLIGYEIP